MAKNPIFPPVFYDLPHKLQRYIYQGRQVQAIALMQKLITDGGGLFREDQSEREFRRIVWLVQIMFLREWGRLAEALAWTCLECELHPENISAIALKEQLKRNLNILPDTIEAKRIANPEWEGVAGMHALKVMLERDVILPFLEPSVYKRFNVTMPNGILFYGPPGCGKTFIARKLAEQIGFYFREIKPSDYASTYVHGTQGIIGKIFKEAEENAPCIMFFDEFEAIAKNRTNPGMEHHYASEVNELLTQLDNAAKRDILVIGATNFPGQIDPAIRRTGRLDKKYFIGPPDLEARIEALKLALENTPHDKINWISIAEDMNGYSFSDIKFMVDELIRKAIQGAINEKKMVHTINQGMLFEAITNFKPNLNENDLRQYMEND